MAQYFMQRGAFIMNKKYKNYMLQRSRPFLTSKDYKVVIFKFGKRKVPMFYLSVYRDD